jgi:RNase P/RNase MRP subunit POP5
MPVGRGLLYKIAHRLQFSPSRLVRNALGALFGSPTCNSVRVWLLAYKISPGGTSKNRLKHRSRADTAADITMF